MLNQLFISDKVTPEVRSEVRAWIDHRRPLIEAHGKCLDTPKGKEGHYALWMFRKEVENVYESLDGAWDAPDFDQKYMMTHLRGIIGTVEQELSEVQGADLEQGDPITAALRALANGADIVAIRL